MQCVSVCVCCSQRTKCTQNMHFFPPTKVTKELTHFIYSYFSTNEKKRWVKSGHTLLIKWIWVWIWNYSSAVWTFIWIQFIWILLWWAFKMCRSGEFWSKQNESKLHHKSIKFQTNEHFQMPHIKIKTIGEYCNLTFFPCGCVCVHICSSLVWEHCFRTFSFSVAS